jgi:hypothetical protein
MSRGPGRIERAIRALFDAHPDRHISTDDLVAHCYPGINHIERKHRVAVLRAAHKVVAADPDWTTHRSFDHADYSLPPLGHTYFFRRDNKPSWATPSQRAVLAAMRR